MKNAPKKKTLTNDRFLISLIAMTKNTHTFLFIIQISIHMYDKKNQLHSEKSIVCVLFLYERKKCWRHLSYIYQSQLTIDECLLFVSKLTA